MGDAHFLQLGDALSHRCISHVGPAGDLVAGLAREAVAAAVIQGQVIEIPHRELEQARCGGSWALHAGQQPARRERPSFEFS